MTRTYATLEVSWETYDEIYTLLREAGYQHAFVERENTNLKLIDMNGIALIVEKKT